MASCSLPRGDEEDGCLKAGRWGGETLGGPSVVGGEEKGRFCGWAPLMLSIHAAGSSCCVGELRLAPRELWGEGRGSLRFC